MVTKFGKNKLKSAEVQSGFVNEIEKLKEKYPKVYPVNQWMASNNLERIQKWNNQDSRRDLIKEDQEIRKSQNRIRGQGPDFIFE